MAAHALFDALPDFGMPRPMPRAVEPMRLDTATPPPPAEPEPEKVTIDELERAVAQARIETEERVRAHCELEIAVLEQKHATETEGLRRELGEQAGAAIATRFRELEARLASSSAAVVARILGVALTEEVTRNAVEELGRTVAAALADRDAVRLRITGPQSLLEALRPSLGANAERAEFIEAPGLDVTVSVDSALYETRISAWSAALAEALSGAQT